MSQSIQIIAPIHYRGALRGLQWYEFAIHQP